MNMKEGGKCCTQIPELGLLFLLLLNIAFSSELPDKQTKTRHLGSHYFYLLKGNISGLPQRLCYQALYSKPVTLM